MKMFTPEMVINIPVRIIGRQRLRYTTGWVSMVAPGVFSQHLAPLLASLKSKLSQVYYLTCSLLSPSDIYFLGVIYSS